MQNLTAASVVVLLSESKRWSIQNVPYVVRFLINGVIKSTILKIALDPSWNSTY